LGPVTADLDPMYLNQPQALQARMPVLADEDSDQVAKGPTNDDQFGALLRWCVRNAFRAMICRMTSDVPSRIRTTRVSRQISSIGNSLVALVRRAL
jgi:hypothetical protein